MTSNDTPKKDAKLESELTLILKTFRLEADGRVIRISTSEEPKLTLKDNGYLYVSAGSRTDDSRRLLRWHRVIYALHHRCLPERIDHKDGDRSNNAIGNLRPCSPAQNAANASYSNHPMPVSGYRNVYRMPNGKYKGRTRIGGRRPWTAPYSTPEEAKDAIEALRKAHHGDYHRRTKRVPVTPRSTSASRKTVGSRAAALYKRQTKSKRVKRTSKRPMK